MDECAICLNEIPEIDKCINDCGYSFCKSCIDTGLIGVKMIVPYVDIQSFISINIFE